MSDLIDRQVAIDAINTWDKFGVDERNRVVKWHEGLEPYIHLRDVVTAIINLPSAQSEIIRCKDCEYWQTDDGTFPDFDGSIWHECKCLYMFRAPDGEPARTTADFWCGYGERRKDNGIET